jgi:hypothetical protein
MTTTTTHTCEPIPSALDGVSTCWECGESTPDAVDDDARLADLSARNRVVLPALREIETTTAALRKQFARRAPRRSEEWVARQQRIIDEHDVVLASLREQKGAIDAEMRAIFDRQFAAHESASREITDAVVATIVPPDDMHLVVNASSDYPSIELVSDDERTRVTVYGPRPKYVSSASRASLVVESYSAPTISHPSSWSSNLVADAARMARFLWVAVTIADTWTAQVTLRGARIA